MSKPLALVAATLTLASPLAQAPQPPSTFTAATMAVMVDVVVRDGKGRPVTDLRKDDFELLEDGVRQVIADMTVVVPPMLSASAEAAVAVSPGAASRPRTTVETPTVVALVFDRLSPEARALAHRGALAYLQTSRENDFAGVFLSDVSLVTVQTYTNDRAKVKEAIDAVASRATSVFSRENDRVMPTAHGDPDPRVSPTASAEFHGAPDANTAQALKNAAAAGGPLAGESGLALMALRMERQYERMSRDEQGYTTTNALLALVDSLGTLPGRKTVVFFAEGLAIPPAVQARFTAVIAAANRANVSVYTVDAAGLRVHSQTAETSRQVRELGAVGVGDASIMGGGWLRNLEWNEDVLRQDPHASLSMLAKETGGFLVGNTNDLARAFDDVDADRRFHYLLTYTPKNADFDGEWRTISVRVPGRRVQVRARTGYVAVRAPGAIPLLAYEGPALAALERTPPPVELPVRASAFVFPASGTDSAGEERLALLVVAESATLTLAPDAQKGTFRSDFTVLARIRDASGEVVRKGSQPYRLSGPVASLERARQGEVLFFRQPSLPAGQYTLEAAVHDALSGKAGVVSHRFEVPMHRGLGVSSLIVVQRGERLPSGEVQQDNPLQMGDLLIYPNTGEPISKSTGALTLFLTVVPSSGHTPAADLEVLSEHGSLTAKVVVTFDAPKDDRIQQLWRIPLESLAPGVYTWRVTVTDGQQREVREAHLRIVP